MSVGERSDVAPAVGSAQTTVVECDVLVVGSGAGGLAAAVTASHAGARVVVIERAHVLGGATSWSGGWMWAPRSFFAKAAGIEDEIGDLRAYLQATVGDEYDAERIDAFLENAPEMVDFFHQETFLQFVPGTWIADIYGDVPGAGVGSRSVAPKPLNARHIPKALRRRLRRQLYETSFLGMGIMAGPDLQGFLAASRGNIQGLVHAARRVSQYLVDLTIHQQGMRFVNGTALTARLVKSAVDLGVQLHVRTSAEKLLTDNDGQVVGAEAVTPEGRTQYIARRGVVLATGGYPNSIERRSATFPRTPTGQEHWTLAPETCDGTGVLLAESVGAKFRDDLASPAAWCPVSLVPYRKRGTRPFPHIMDRAKPGSIGVLSTGQRFVNEANGYYDYVAAMVEKSPVDEPVQAWQIADHTFVRRYPLGMAKPRPVPLFPYVYNGYLIKARTIEELATKCGINARVLSRTVEEFNADARAGADRLFGRGSTPFNRSGGDPKVGPNPSLAPIEKPPFYAVRILPGSFGTFAGIATDARSRALDESGQPIDGLYIVGNDQASVMGGHYPAGGINLGPAMTFGYIAGRDIVGH